MSPKQHGDENGQASGSASGQIDRKLAADAVRKMAAGQTPTSVERAALKRVEKERDEERRWQHYRSIPQKHWRKMSARQTKVLQEQAERYGIPFGGALIDLTKVVPAFHDFLAANAYKLAATPDDAMMQGGGSSPALEQYRRERTKLARLDRLQREGSLVPRDSTRERLSRIAAILRTAAENLQQRFGDEAAAIVIDALADAQREIDQFFGGAESDEPNPAREPGQ